MSELPNAAGERGWDVFISYAREDSGWVRESLYEPLVRCRTASGDRPRVFFDVEKEGIPPGGNWQNFLAEAIPRSRTIVPIYSVAYFDKKMCRWELGMAFQLDPDAEEGRVAPLLLDPRAEPHIPPKMCQHQFELVARPDWFTRLCARLQLTPPRQPPVLGFLDQPADIAAAHTLPPVRVEVLEDGRRVSEPEQVTLTAEKGAIWGTVTLETVDGIATFRDLSIPEPQAAVRLVASAEGCVAAFSEPFEVSAAEPPAEVVQVAREEPESTRLEARGEPWFFADEKAVLVLEDGGGRVFGLDGEPLAGFELRAAPRLLRRRGPLLALADWSGEVHLLASGGEHHRWDLAAGRTGGLTVIGDLQIEVDEEAALAALWDGRVCRLRPGVGEAEPVLEHRPGVQAMVGADDRLAVCGLDGVLVFYRGERPARSHQLEPTVRLLVERAGCIVVVGETRLYRIPLGGGRALGEEPGLGAIRAALGEGPHPLIVDTDGRGAAVDDELRVVATFHAGPGAVPTSTDRAGRSCVCRTPGGSHAVIDFGAEAAGPGVRAGRVVLTHGAGGLAVSPTGELIALGDPDGVSLLPARRLEALAERG